MSQSKRSFEQSNSVRQALREVKGGALEGVEGGLRIDAFDHDANSEYDFTEDSCSICELPEHAQNLIVEDIESEETA